MGVRRGLLADREGLKGIGCVALVPGPNPFVNGGAGATSRPPPLFLSRARRSRSSRGSRQVRTRSSHQVHRQCRSRMGPDGRYGGAGGVSSSRPLPRVGKRRSARRQRACAVDPGHLLPRSTVCHHLRGRAPSHPTTARAPTLSTSRFAVTSQRPYPKRPPSPQGRCRPTVPPSARKYHGTILR